MADPIETDRIIYDIGVHKGEDSEFYLAKGFHVVGVEADPGLAQALEKKFAAEIVAGRYMLVQRAIAAHANEKITFYSNPQNSVWGTIDPNWADRNREHYATESHAITVETTTMPALVAQYGKPYYVKIDIEGADMLCLAQIGELPIEQRPRYVSIESSMVSLDEINDELSLFKKLGYHDFKVVPQHDVHYQKPVFPPREGKFVSHRPRRDSSGHFGEEAPGQWLPADQTFLRYRRVFWFYQMNGVNGILNRWAPAKWRSLVMKIWGRLGFRAGWYDTHARLGENNE